MTGSYQLVSNVSDSRPSTDTYPPGTFKQDWEYVEGSGDLDDGVLRVPCDENTIHL